MKWNGLYDSELSREIKDPARAFPSGRAGAVPSLSWAEHRDAGDTPIHSTGACSCMRALQGAQPYKDRWSGKCLARWEQCALPASSPASNQPLFMCSEAAQLLSKGV